MLAFLPDSPRSPRAELTSRPCSRTVQQNRRKYQTDVECREERIVESVAEAIVEKPRRRRNFRSRDVHEKGTGVVPAQ